MAYEKQDISSQVAGFYGSKSVACGFREIDIIVSARGVLCRYKGHGFSWSTGYSGMANLLPSD
jgi:hypothetical protein